MTMSNEIDKANAQKMKAAGLTGRVPWGEILEIRTFGDIAVIEAQSWQVNREGENVMDTHYWPYVAGKPCHEITQKGWDKALLIALGKKYKTYPDFAGFAELMLRME